MPLSSFLFLAFLLLAFIIHALIPRKVRWVWLLLVSYAFLLFFDLKYILVLLAVTAVTFICGLLIGKSEERKKKKLYVTLGTILTLAVLFVFKYLNFSINVLDDLLRIFGISSGFQPLDLLLPIGLSFYTFQTVSYMMDCYNDLVQPERNFGRYALYVAFFPKLLSGPIERASHLFAADLQPRAF